MSSVKDQMADVVSAQPDDATYEEIIRELAFERMVARGLADSRNGRVVSNEEMGRRIHFFNVPPKSPGGGLLVTG